jgi:hypothetical protein
MKPRTRVMLLVTLLLLLFIGATVWMATDTIIPRPNSGSVLSAR